MGRKWEGKGREGKGQKGKGTFPRIFLRSLRSPFLSVSAVSVAFSGGGEKVGTCHYE